MKRVLISLLSMSLLLSAFSLGQPHKQLRPFKGEGPRMKFMEELNLTEDQKKDLEKIRFDSMNEMIDIRSKMAKSRLELQKLFQADAPDRSAIEKKLGEVSQFQSQMAQKRINGWFAVNKILTPDQQKVWKKSLGKGHFGQNPGGMRQRFMRGEMMKPGMRFRNNPDSFHRPMKY